MATDPKDKKKKLQKKLTKLVKKRTHLKEKEIKGPLKNVRTKIKTKRLKNIQKKINKNPIAQKNKRDGDAKDRKSKKQNKTINVVDKKGLTKTPKLKKIQFRKSIPLDNTPPPTKSDGIKKNKDLLFKRMKKEASSYRLKKIQSRKSIPSNYRQDYRLESTPPPMKK